MSLSKPQPSTSTAQQPSTGRARPAIFGPRPNLWSGLGHFYHGGVNEEHFPGSPNVPDVLFVNLIK